MNILIFVKSPLLNGAGCKIPEMCFRRIHLKQLCEILLVNMTQLLTTRIFSPKSHCVLF